MSDKNIPDLRHLYGEFVSENRDIIEKLSRDLIYLENRPDDPGIINGLFRSAHTLKGNAGFIGLAPLGEIAHGIENVLDRLREGEIAFSPRINDVFFSAIDIASQLLDDFIAGGEGARDLGGILGDLQGLAGGAKGEAVKGCEEKRSAEPESKRGSARKEGKDTSFMRVNTARLDRMVNLVGELATGRSRLARISSRLKNDDLAEITAYINNISAQLQNEVLGVRMIPVKELLGRFHRLVRDTSRSLGKDVKLVVEGEDTELDKGIIEFLYDPLVHLVRNSIGHGIEERDERERLWKNGTGTIIINACHKHNCIYIRVSDDGRGLNIDDIRAKAVERGIVGAEDAGGLSDEEVSRFVFASGFSTAKGVDSVSGRGVGMDVVRANIEKIGGDVYLEWEEGKGTAVTVKAPLTLAIAPLFLVRDGRHIFGIPMPYVDETVMVPEREIEYMNGQMVYMLRHKPLPIMNLAELFDLRKGDDGGDRTYNVVILGMMNMKAGIVVDEFIGKVETVIKPLGPFIDRLSTPVEGISGASILGSGEISLVLDVPAIWKML